MYMCVYLILEIYSLNHSSICLNGRNACTWKISRDFHYWHNMYSANWDWMCYCYLLTLVKPILRGLTEIVNLALDIYIKTIVYVTILITQIKKWFFFFITKTSPVLVGWINWRHNDRIYNHIDKWVFIGNQGSHPY